MGLFLAPHGLSNTSCDIPQPGFLRNNPAGFDCFNLSLNFILQGILDKLKRVNIFDLSFCAQSLLSCRPNRYIGITPERPLLHVAVTYAQIAQNRAELSHKRSSLLRGSDVWLRDNFQKRHASTIQIHIAPCSGVNIFPCILLHMNPCNANPPGLTVYLNLCEPTRSNWQLKLADLITLWQVRIKIILTGKSTNPCNLTIKSQPCHYCKGYDFSVKHRKHSRHPYTDRAGLRVWLSAESGGTAAKDFGFCKHLSMNLKSNHTFIVHIVSS